MCEIAIKQKFLKEKIKESDTLIEEIKKKLETLVSSELIDILNRSNELKKGFFELRTFFFDKGNQDTDSNSRHYKWAESARLSYDLHQNYENQLTYAIQQIHNDAEIASAKNSLNRARIYFIWGIIATVSLGIASIVLAIVSFINNRATEKNINKIQTNIEIISYYTDNSNYKLDSLIHILNESQVKSEINGSAKKIKPN